MSLFPTQIERVTTHGDEPIASDVSTHAIADPVASRSGGAISAPRITSPPITVHSFLFEVPLCDQREFASLPDRVIDDVRYTLAALKIVYGSKCRAAAFRSQAYLFKDRRGFSVETLERKLDAYLQSGGDWHSLINRSRAGAKYWDTGQSTADRDLFIAKYWQPLCAANKRSGGCEAAYRKFEKTWKSGLDAKGKPFDIPGYGTWQKWFAKNHPNEPLPVDPVFPPGLSYRNLMRRKQPKAQLTLARQGISAARAFTPYILGTRVGMKFLQEVLFDDVKVDFRVLNPDTGQVMDLWLLVAMDRATGMILGYGMRPAKTREDGTQEHLRLADMKQLAGWVIERYGIPPYVMTWVVENGTATFTDAVAAAIGALFENRIRLRFASMIGGKSTAGYQERGLGNSKSKASLESSFHLMHNEAGDLPAQVGRRYDVRPMDLGSREREATQIWDLAQQLPANLRGQSKFPVLALQQARVELNRIFEQMNTRTDHELEGYEPIWEWRATPQHAWSPLTTIPDDLAPGYDTRKRKESPLERMRSLIADVGRVTPGDAYTDGGANVPVCPVWSAAPPLALTAFYDFTQRLVEVDAKGEIAFRLDGRDYLFRAPLDGEHTRPRVSDLAPSPNPSLSPSLAPGTKLLAYHHPRELDYLHLTRLKPHSGYVATWIKRTRVAAGDTAALAAQMEYTRGAMAAHRAAAAETAGPERADLDAMRSHNANLHANAAALDADPNAIISTAALITPPTAGAPITDHCPPSSQIARSLDAARSAIARTKTQTKTAEQSEQDLVALGMESLLANVRQPQENYGEPNPK
jgi:hypothetical protein